MRESLRSLVTVCILITFTSARAPSQSTGSDVPAAPAHISEGSGHAGEVGIGVKLSLLGAGAEAAVRLTEHTNVRAGFNMIKYSRGFDKDGVAYNGELNFQTFEAHLDYFPWAKSFHISPGLLVYAADPITATAAVPGNQSFSLGGVAYYSDPSNPVTGNGKITFNRAAPMITIGWGNLVPRKEGKHFSVPFEIGIAFQGTPKANLSLAGSVCEQPGINCRPIPADPIIQSNITSEQNKIKDNMTLFKVYPIISLGIGYKF
ncbi:MAG TPA: hypothetical protein VFA67_15135 [Candidatus Sulfotelmatobacter sp.]|nr:hypothetical protein [Candidatus Sulfotelmatobacter sp.]